MVLVDSKERMSAFLTNYPSFKAVFQHQISIEADSPEQITSIIENKLIERGYFFEKDSTSEILLEMIKKQMYSSIDAKTIIDGSILKIEKNQTDRLIKLISSNQQLNNDELSSLKKEDFNI